MPARNVCLPADLRFLFWDVTFDDLAVEQNRDFIVARIAEHGTDAAIRWLRGTYGEAAIAQALESRCHLLSAGTLNVWRLWLRKPEDWCATIPSRPLRGRFWKS